MRKLSILPCLVFFASFANATNIDLQHNLLLAATKGKLQRVKEYVEEWNAEIDFVGPSGLTALHYALLNDMSGEGQCDVARYLIEQGANLHVDAPFRGTPQQLIDAGYCKGRLFPAQNVEE